MLNQLEQTAENYLAGLDAESVIQDSGYLPDACYSNGSRFAGLPPIVRALLLADGTVTLTLEAYFQEPVKIQTLRQDTYIPGKSIAILESSANQSMMFRKVKLVGCHSNKVYVDAWSLLVKEAIEDELWQMLQGGEIGMGILLRQMAGGNYRELLHVDSGDPLNSNNDDIYRTYRVMINNRPAIAITEVFHLGEFV